MSVFLHEILNTLCRSKQTKDGEASTVSGSLLCNFRFFNRTTKKVRVFPLQFDSQRNGFVESKKSNKQSIFCDQISTVHINRKRTLCIFFGKTKIDGKYMIMMIIVEKYKWEREEGELAKDSVRQRKTLQGNVA